MIDTLKKKGFWVSLIMMLICSLIAKYLAIFPGLHIIGHLVIALILGMLIQLLPRTKKIAKVGTGLISNKFLRLGIILLGFRLNLHVLMDSGVKTIVLAATVVVFTISIVYFIAKSLKIDKTLALLASCGCGICGAAAVMGVSPSLKASEDDEVISIACVCILGTVFTISLVLLRPLLPVTTIQYGVIAGGSLHEIAHAVAAGSAGGVAAEEIATIVKLSRVLMLAPVSLACSIIYSKKFNNSGNVKHKVVIPWFMAGFILTSILGTYLPIPKETLNVLVMIAYVVLGMAMASLGVNVDFGVIRRRGGKVFLASIVGSVLLIILVFFLAKAMF